MNELLAKQLDDVLAEPARLSTEAQLHVAAATLARAAPDEITATTVVGVLGADDRSAFEALVHEIADELELDATIRLRVGSFSVRFSRRVPVAATAPRPATFKGLLAGLVSGLRAGS
jgi:hypothetical protein